MTNCSLEDIRNYLEIIASSSQMEVGFEHAVAEKDQVEFVWNMTILMYKRLKSNRSDSTLVHKSSPECTKGCGKANQ